MVDGWKGGYVTAGRGCKGWVGWDGRGSVLSINIGLGSYKKPLHNMTTGLWMVGKVGYVTARGGVGGGTEGVVYCQ